MKSIRLSKGASEIDAIMEVIEGETVIDAVGTDVAFEPVALLLQEYDWDTLLDVGCGNGEHSRIFRHFGKRITTTDAVFDCDIKGDFLTLEFPEQYDVVFCSHVLEHQRNIGVFLDRLIAACKPGGLIAISVPPEMGHHFLLAHPNHFNIGSLMYHLVMAGIDCSEARGLTYGYNSSVVVRNVRHALAPQSWAYEGECGQFLPAAFSRNGNQINGALRSINWQPRSEIAPLSYAGVG